MAKIRINILKKKFVATLPNNAEHMHAGGDPKIINLRLKALRDHYFPEGLYSNVIRQRILKQRGKPKP